MPGSLPEGQHGGCISRMACLGKRDLRAAAFVRHPAAKIASVRLNRRKD